MPKRHKKTHGSRLLSVALAVVLAASCAMPPGASLAFADAPDLMQIFATSLDTYLPFDNNSSNVTTRPTVEDNVDYRDGKFGQAAHFGQKSSNVKLNGVSYGATDDFSIMMWVRDLKDGGDPVLFGNKDWNSGANPGFLFSTRSGDIRFNANVQGGSRVDFNTDKSIQDGQWHHFAATVSRTDARVNLYIDGVLSGGGDISAYAGKDLDVPSLTSCVGNDGTGNYQDSTPNHTIDDFFLFKKALSTEEISALYEASDYLPRLYFGTTTAALDCEDSITPGVSKIDGALSGTWMPLAYTSDNTSLVTVDSQGIVTANNSGITGTTKVHVSSIWNGTFPLKASLTVTVNPDDGRIFRKTDEVTLNKGESALLPLKTPYKNDASVGYTIDRPQVASINTVTGEVSGLAQGTTVLTASKAGLPSDSVTIRVNDTTPTGKQFVLDKTLSGGAIPVGYQATVPVTTNDTGNVPVWRSANPTIVSVSAQGKIEALSTGTTRVYAKVNLPSNEYIEDWVTITVGNPIPLNVALIGATSATVETPFLVNVHMDTGTVAQPIKTLALRVKYDPAVFSFVPGYRETGATYNNDAASGTLTATYSFGGGKTNANLDALATASRIGTFCFELKDDAPRDTTQSSLTIEEATPSADGVSQEVFVLSKQLLSISTAFNPSSDFNGDGLVSIGDVAKAANRQEAHKAIEDDNFGFYPVKRIVYLGIDGGGNFMTPEAYYTTDNSTYNWAGKPQEYRFDLFEGSGGLAETGSYTANAQTSNPPISGQNWTAMFWGYEPLDNPAFGIDNGTADSKYYPIATSPYESIFSLLRKAQPNRAQSTFIEWGSMENGIIPNNTGAYQYRGGNNIPLQTATEMITDGALLDSSFMFIDCDHYMDGVGHSSGYYNQTYYEASKTLMKDLEKLVDAIYTDPKLKDDTVLMIGNDHGGFGTGHGNWRPSEYYMMMYARGPVIKANYAYNGDSGTLGNRGSDDALQKDWPALFAKAMGIKGSSSWVGTTGAHDIFLTQEEMATAKPRNVESVKAVKKSDGYEIELANVVDANKEAITAAHIVLSRKVSTSKIEMLQGAKMETSYVQDGKLNIIVKSDKPLTAGAILTIHDTTEGLKVSNAMLGRNDGIEIYPNLGTANDSTTKAAINPPVLPLEKIVEKEVVKVQAPPIIKPSKAIVNKLRVGKKKLAIAWKKVANVSAYEVNYRIKGSKRWNVKTVSSSKNKLTLKSLKAGKRYQVRIRSYQTVSNARHYSGWSKTYSSKKMK